VDLQKYRALFVDEASEHLAEMTRALADLESGAGSSSEAVDTLFRMTHSIKGMAASLDYLSASTLAHRLEDWLEPMRKHGQLPEAGLSLVYDVVQALEEMVSIVDGTGDSPPPRDDLLQRLAEPAQCAPREKEARAPEKKARWLHRPCRAACGFVPRPSTASLPLSVI